MSENGGYIPVRETRTGAQGDMRQGARIDAHAMAHTHRLQVTRRKPRYQMQ